MKITIECENCGLMLEIDREYRDEQRNLDRLIECPICMEFMYEII